MEVKIIAAREKCISKAPGGGRSRAFWGNGWFSKIVILGKETWLLREHEGLDLASVHTAQGIRLWALQRGKDLQHDSRWFATLVRTLRCRSSD